MSTGRERQIAALRAHAAKKREEASSSITCAFCGRERRMKRSEAAFRKFCSKRCFWSFNKGENNPGWQGGTYIDGQGYRHIQLESGRYQYEHRVVMEAALGRKLSSKEVVHHKNEDRLDNRIENLELFSSPGQHIGSHHVTRGTDQPAAKLNDDKVRQLRKMANDGLGRAHIARHFGVSRATIRNVLKGRAWKHVE